MQDALSFVRRSFQTWLRTPTVAVIAVLTLALGIGANTAIFSVVNAILLRPLPFPDADRLVQIKKDSPGIGVSPFVSLSEFQAWQQRSQTVDPIAAFESGQVNLSGNGDADRVNRVRVSSAFFPLLGVRPAVGRTFLPGDFQAGSERVALLDHAYWMLRFGGDPSVASKVVRLDNESCTIIGVLPAGFRFPDRYDTPCDLWMPLSLGAGNAKYAMPTFVRVIARLKPGVILEQAHAELDGVLKSTLRPGRQARAVVIGWHDEIAGDVKPKLLIFLGTVGAILLIACVNIANLLLARSANRGREMAIRAALGAGRIRLLRQLLAESLALAVIGGLVGLLLAYWGSGLVQTYVMSSVPHFRATPVDVWVLGFTSLLTLMAGLIFGIAPALRATSVDLNAALKEGGRSSTGLRTHRLSNLLVVVEVALALMLLIGAGLLLKSYTLLHRVDPGFQPGHMLSMTIDLPSSRYGQAHAQSQYFQQVLQRVEGLPGVRYAAVTACMPLAGFSMTSSIEVDAPGTAAGDTMVSFNTVSADYFRAMGIPLQRGRYLGDADREGAPSVAVVNESFARLFFRDQDPLGRRVMGAFQKGDWMTVVGVVGDVRQDGLESAAPPQIYRSYLQAGSPVMSVLVLAAGDPVSLKSVVRAQVASVDGDQAVFGIQTLEQQLAGTLAPRRINMVLMGVFSLMALILACGGIYGVVSNSVGQRTHEIGVRMALGARGRDVLAMIVGRSMRAVLAGSILGLLAALAVARYFASLLYGVSASDPWLYAGVGAMLLAVAFVASYVPSRRATRVDPLLALRHE